jgi:hypothetical protein
VAQLSKTKPSARIGPFIPAKAGSPFWVRAFAGTSLVNSRRVEIKSAPQATDRNYHIAAARRYWLGVRKSKSPEDLHAELQETAPTRRRFHSRTRTTRSDGSQSKPSPPCQLKALIRLGSRGRS